MAVKQCTKCSEIKPVSEFCRRSASADGLSYHCRSCKSIDHNVWRVENRDREKELGRINYARHKQRIIDRAIQWQKNNPEKISARNKRRYQRVKEHHSKIMREWGKANRVKTRAYCMQYYTAKMKAFPAWADRKAIERIYEHAAKLGHHVDHIVPLKSNIVCGLHCEANLQPLPPSENIAKSNRHWPDMP